MRVNFPFFIGLNVDSELLITADAHDGWAEFVRARNLDRTPLAPDVALQVEQYCEGYGQEAMEQAAVREMWRQRQRVRDEDGYRARKLGMDYMRTH